MTKIAKLQTLHKVFNLTCGSFLGSLCQKISREMTDKKNNTVTAHFTWSAVSKLLLIATVIFSCLVNFVSPFSFASSGNTLFYLFSNIDAVSCWQKRGRNLSAAFNSEVQKKIEL